MDRVNARENRIAMECENRAQQTCDPRRLSGAAVYQEVQREFSRGGRVQFTAPSGEVQAANRELGTIDQVSHSGNLGIRLENAFELSQGTASVHRVRDPSGSRTPRFLRGRRYGRRCAWWFLPRLSRVCTSTASCPQKCLTLECVRGFILLRWVTTPSFWDARESGWAKPRHDQVL